MLLDRRALAFLSFLLPSAVGLGLFVIPLRYEDSYTIAVGIVSGLIQSSLKTVLPALILSTILVSFLGSLIGYFKSRKVSPGPSAGLWARLFCISPWWMLVRGLAAAFAVMVFWQIGVPAISSERTAGLLLHELLPTIFCMFLTAGFLLPLLLDFGLLEFIGVLTSRIMRPIFTLPGRASIDCLASWLGDGTIGVLLTNLQYVEGHYTAREAAIIATSFSFVSLSFSIVILAQVKLMSYVLPFYVTIVVVGLVCAIVMPRIPPLSRKADTYYDKPAESRRPLQGDEQPSLKLALERALVASERQKGLGSFLRGGASNVLEMWLTVIPVVMMFGTVALLLAEFTPLFKWLGTPFVPLLELLGIPYAADLSQAVVIGFADMFLPAVLASTCPSDMGRFVIAALSVSQLVFMSEVGGLILGTKIPVSFKDLVVVYLLRTLIGLPIVAGAAHLIF